MMGRLPVVVALGLAGALSLTTPTAPERPLRIAVIGDINASYGTVGYGPEVGTAVRRIVELDPDLVIGVGDLIAGQQTRPQLERERLEAMWNAFDRQVLAPLEAAGIPFVPAPGNHDASASPGFGLERQIFREQWERHRPSVAFVGGEEDHDYPFRYAFDLGDVRFAILDATTVGPLGADQRDWLSAVLDVPEAGPRVRVVAAHLPIHAFAQGREKEILADAPLEALLGEREVDLFLSGHHHAFYPGYSGGVRYVSQGALGSGPRRLIGETKRSARSFTIIEIGPGGSIEVKAFSGPDFTSTIAFQSLPDGIRYGKSVLVREDLALDR